MKSKWTFRPLGELVDFSSGGTPSKRKSEYWTGSIPWISAKTLKSERITTSDLFISEDGLNAGSKLAPCGSILLLIRGSGLFNGIPIGLAEKEVAFNQDIKCLNSCSEVENKFIFYWLLSQRNYLMAKVGVTGIGAGKFDLDFLQKLEVPIPSEQERHQIIAVGDALSDKIELNQRINENLERQAQAIFQRWLLENDGQYTFQPLAEVAEINPNTYSPKESWEYVNYLDTSSITNGTISEIQYICPETEKLPSRARRKVQKGDIVYSTVRPNQHHFGIISSPLLNMLVSTGFAVIRSKRPQICNELIYLLITDNNFIEKMQQLAEQSTSTFPSIKPSDLGTCLIPCPINSDGDKLSEQLKTIYNLIAINNEQNEKFALVRNTLLPKLMSGEIELSNI